LRGTLPRNSGARVLTLPPYERLTEEMEDLPDLTRSPKGRRARVDPDAETERATKLRRRRL